MLSWIPWLKNIFLFTIKIYVSMLSYRVNFSTSPSMMDTIQSKLHAIWFPNTPFPMSSLLLSKAQIVLGKINAKPAWNMWRQSILCTQPTFKKNARSLLLDNLTSWTPEDLVTDLQSWQLNKFAFSSPKEKLVRLLHSSFTSFFFLYMVSQTKLGFNILLWN